MPTATELQRPTIRLLPDAVKSRIAAGEVIERPASIVKELVENALDAGATSVDVQIEGGGRELLRVRDNGCGMSAADLALAVQRHATSKLVEADDLYRLETLGFRGEALPSIGSVSHMTLVSRPRGADEAHKLVLHGGERTEGPAPTGADYGTTVEVRELFFNLPARKKFLKGAGAEAAACADTLLRLALTRPDVAFTLRQGRQEVLACAAVGEGTPAEQDASGLKAYALRARALLGAAATKGMVPLSASGPAAGFSGENLRTNIAESAEWPRRKAGPGTFEGYRLFGLVTPPAQTRANRSCIYLAVNGRPVRDRTLTTALLEAYRHLVPPKRYPAAVLFLECPGEDVDLNVHPAKSEVRFRIPGLIFSMLHYAVRKAFVAGEPEAQREAPAPNAPERSTTAHYAPAPAQTSFDLWQGPREAPAPASEHSNGAHYAPAPAPKAYAPYAPSRAAEAPAAPAIERLAPAQASAPQLAPPAEDRAARAPEAPAFRVLGQAGGMYMVVEDDEGVKLFDQHALHERILFEQLMARARGEAPVEKQGLLLPETLELSPAQAAVFDSAEAKETLAALGFDAAEFGPRAVAVRAVPAVLKTARAARLLVDVLEALAGVSDDHPAGKKAPGKEALREKAAYVLSCKGALKAGERLTNEQMQALLHEYHRVVGARGYTCPHGRPLAVQLTWTDLERGVGRS